MRKTFKVILLISCLCMIIFLTGCSRNETNTLSPSEEAGSLVVQISFSDLKTANALMQSVTDELTISSVEVSVSNGTITKTKTAEITDGTVSIPFVSLDTGNWNVTAVAKDTENIVVYSGSTTATITYNAVTTVDIKMMLEPGDLNIDIIMPKELSISSGTVTLVDLTGNDIIRDIEINGSLGVVSFNDIRATTWPVRIELYDGSNSLEKNKQITVLPGRTTSVQIDFNQGTIDIRFSWEIAPVEPTGLKYTIENGNIVLSWDPNPEENIAGYLVYRSDYETWEKVLLNDSLITETTYIDSNVVSGNTYYYWVQAHNTDGLSSGLSGPLAATSLLSSSDYFITTEGYGIKYHVKDPYYNTDTTYWVVSQFCETGKPDEIDFVFTLLKENDPALNHASSLGGLFDWNNGSDRKITFLYAGFPVGNFVHFYRNFSIPRFFNYGDKWTIGDNKSYTVNYVGRYTINNITFEDCIRVDIEDSQNSEEGFKGNGYFILAKDIGIVKVVFKRTEGPDVLYEYITSSQMTKHTISGTITDNGEPVEGINVQISNSDWGIRSTTNKDGEFSISAYGPDIILRIGYDLDNDYCFEFDDNYPKEYAISNITTDITDLNIDLSNL